MFEWKSTRHSDRKNRELSIITYPEAPVRSNWSSFSNIRTSVGKEKKFIARERERYKWIKDKDEEEWKGKRQ